MNKTTKYSIIISLSLSVTLLGQNMAYAVANGSIYTDPYGIPHVYYTSCSCYVVNPVTASLTGINDYQISKTNPAYLYNLKNIAIWLASNTVNKGNFSTYEYHFTNPHNMTDPWQSSMANGLAIQVMSDENVVKRNQTYVNVSKALLNSFFVDQMEGGVTHKNYPTGYWYEEYAEKTGSNATVLNGMMYTIYSIYNYWQYANDTNAKFLYDQGIIALKNKLPQFDAGRTHGSYYSLDTHEYANPSYNQVHVMQLAGFYGITGEPIFKLYRDKWEPTRIMSKPGLASYWSFDNMTNATTAILQKAKDIKFANATYLQGVAMNGNSSYMQYKYTPNLAKNKTLTIDVWVKTPKTLTKTLNPIVTLSNDEQHGFKLVWDTTGISNYVICSIGDGRAGHYQQLNTKVNFGADQQHNLACVVNSTNVSLYVDGSLKNANSFPTLSNGTAYRSNDSLLIGGNWWNKYYSNLTIDNLQIYNSVISANDIYNEFAIGHGGLYVLP